MDIIPFYFFKKTNTLKNEMLYASNPSDWAITIITSVLANGKKNIYQIILNTDDSSITESSFKNMIIEQSFIVKKNLGLELKILNKLLLIALVKGLLVMFGCLSIIFIIKHFLTENYFTFVCQEALYIIGWVSMWKSVELLIFDKWVIINKLKIIEKFPSYNYNVKQYEI